MKRRVRRLVVMEQPLLTSVCYTWYGLSTPNIHPAAASRTPSRFSPARFLIPIHVISTKRSILRTNISWSELSCKPAAFRCSNTQTTTRFRIEDNTRTRGHKYALLNFELQSIDSFLSQVVHQATFIRQSSNPRRTQHGIICPDCKQEVAHTCSHSLITSSSRYEHPPSSALANLTGLQRHFTSPTAQGNLFDGCITTNSTSFESSTSQVQPLPSSSNTFISRSYPPTSIMLGSPAGVQTHFADLTVQGNLFGEQVTARSVPAPFESSISHFRPPPPNSSDIFSTFMSDPYSVPRLTFSSPSGATSSFPPSCPPGPSSAVHSQYTSNKNNLWLGKRYLRSPDLECEPERKRTRQDLPERRSTNQQSESNDSQRLRLPPIEDSFPLFANTSSASEAVMSPSVPGTPATTSEDSSVISEPESVADWSITYNTEVERELDVTVVRTLEVERFHCLRFSKDGKYLAVGDGNGTTLYDVETGEKTWLVYNMFLFQDGADQPLVLVY